MHHLRGNVVGYTYVMWKPKVRGGPLRGRGPVHHLGGMSLDTPRLHADDDDVFFFVFSRHHRVCSS